MEEGLGAERVQGGGSRVGRRPPGTRELLEVEDRRACVRRRLDDWEMRRGGDGCLGEEWETWGLSEVFLSFFSYFYFSLFLFEFKYSF
jgi:hypothetical protein